MTSAGKILITGGAGSCGRYLTASLLGRGYEVRVIDKDVEPLRPLGNKGLMLFQAGLEDRDALKPAVDGVDAVLHLAWSFSEDPLEVLEQDLRGHIYLLEEAAVDESLRVVPDELWSAVKRRQDEQTKRVGERVARGIDSSRAKHTGRVGSHLFSGLLRCSECGGNYTLVNANKYACAGYAHRHDRAIGAA